jgi:hypothetical protein
MSEELSPWEDYLKMLDMYIPQVISKERKLTHLEFAMPWYSKEYSQMVYGTLVNFLQWKKFLNLDVPEFGSEEHMDKIDKGLLGEDTIAEYTLKDGFNIKDIQTEEMHKDFRGMLDTHYEGWIK